MYVKKEGGLLKLSSSIDKYLYKKIEDVKGNYMDSFGVKYEIITSKDFICSQEDLNKFEECENLDEYLNNNKLFNKNDKDYLGKNVSSLNISQIDQNVNISLTEDAVNFIMMGMQGVSTLSSDGDSLNKNAKGGNGMGNYLGNQIYKGKLEYDAVIARYPQFKDEIDAFLEMKLAMDGIKIK